MTGVDESLVTPVVVQLLRDELPCPVGNGMNPAPIAGQTTLSVEDGWVVVSVAPIGAAYAGQGMANQPDAVEWLEYQLAGIGASQNHASFLASQAATVLTGRTGGDWSNALAVPDHVVVDRKRAGRMADQPDREFFQSGQRVRLLVHRSA